MPRDDSTLRMALHMANRMTPRDALQFLESFEDDVIIRERLERVTHPRDESSDVSRDDIDAMTTRLRESVRVSDNLLTRFRDSFGYTIDA